jgi:hypothetical protein
MSRRNYARELEDAQEVIVALTTVDEYRRHISIRPVEEIDFANVKADAFEIIATAHLYHALRKRKARKPPGKA